MGYKGLLSKIDELRALVGSWQGDSEPALIEKDMALERVKSIYEMLRFPSEEVEQVEEVAVSIEVEEVAEVAEMEESEVSESQQQPSEEVEPQLVEEPQIIESLDEQSEGDDMLLEFVNVTLVEGAVEEDMIDKEQHEREIAAINQKKRERLSRILSLYDDAEACSEVAASPSETEFVEEVEEAEETGETGETGETEEAEEQECAQPIELEEPTEDDIEEIISAFEEAVESQDVATIDEAISSEEQPSAQEELATEELTVEELTIEEPTIEEQPKVESQLILQLGLNDKILLSHELFGGDDVAMSAALAVIDGLPTIDDAMIYIAENYSWSGDNDGARLLMSLLKNRYQS